MSTKATSLSLLERLNHSDDNDAWEQFDRVYGPLLHTWLVRRGVNADDAEDIKQEVMQMAIVQLRDFEHNGRVGALRNWLRHVMANRLKTFFRRKNRQGHAYGGSDYAAMSNQLEDPTSRLSRAWDEEYHAATCERLLSLVRPEFAEQTMTAFRRVTIEQRQTADVAAELGMSPNAVRIAQSRVMRRLRSVGAGMLE